MPLYGDDSNSELSQNNHAELPDTTHDDGEIRDNESPTPFSENEEAERAHDIFGSEDEYSGEEDDREGRFLGSTSNWRCFTEEERSLAASLDQQQANDLSMHLYNAHKLKAHPHGEEASTSSTHHPKKRRRTKSDSEGSPSWQPDVAWTTWPLRPVLVPRRREQFGAPIPNNDDDDATYRKAEPWMISGDLEEEIKALLLRKAKDQFREATVQDSKVINFRLIVDEDKNEALLDPTVHHIFSDFGKLLLGLHKGRQGSGSLDAARSRSRPRRTSSKNTSDRKGSSSVDIDTDSDKEYVEESTKEPKRRRTLNPRGWNEVINTAALTGWDPQVIKRATARCTSLFGEPLNEHTVETPTAAFYCPVAKCKRKEEPFDKAWRWREHLKRSHKYSVEDIEELEASLAS